MESKIMVDGKIFFVIIHKPPPLGDYTYMFEVPSKIIFSLNHILKAVELTLLAHKKGVSLRNLNLELLRRLLVKKQVKEILNATSVIGENDCIVEVHEKPIAPTRPEIKQCDFAGKEALNIIFEKNVPLPKENEKIEDLLLSLQSLSIAGKWFFD